ncbi:MAG TPA: hypothetical protein VNB94_12400 [Mycobacteriales bacterium]|nr:hypothetical protein [Mycobacteriales bacterium]
MLAERGPVRVAIGLLVVSSLLTGGLRVWSAEGDLADATVILRGIRDATVVDPGAGGRPGVEGESLRQGAVVTTGAAGTATLDVRGRQVRLAPTTTVAVPDGAVAELRRGAVLVDRRTGPTVSVRVGDVILDEVAPGALRIERGFSVRVAVLSGGARARTTDRRLAIPRLHQVAVAGRALPDRAEPLRLTGDDWEREVIPDVTAADVVLTRLARGIDADPSLRRPARLTVLPALYRSAVSGLPSGTGRSEALLPVAIGLTSRQDTAEAAVALASRLRREGGSWGVVAALLSARSADVSRRLAGLLDGARSGSRAVAIGEVGGGRIGPGPAIGPDPAAPAPQPRPSGPSAAPTPGPRPSGSPSGSPSPSPSPRSTVDQVVDTIRRLLPTPTPIPAVPPPVPSASPSALIAATVQVR